MLRAYTLDDLDTSDYRVVEKTVLEIQDEVFPRANTEMISQLFADTHAMFEGTYWDYQPMDTAYHNLEHTLQATLVLDPSGCKSSPGKGGTHYVGTRF